MAKSKLHPSDGARFVLEHDRASEDGRRAHYRASIFTPSAQFDYQLELELGGEPQVHSSGVAGGAELERRLLGFARQLSRAACTRERDGLPPWPAHIVRWRGPSRSA